MPAGEHHYFGQSALVSQTYSGGNIVRLLLEKGADSDVPDDMGRIAFSCAASQSDGTILIYLADYNPDGLSRRDFYGRTPLHLAATHGELQSVRAPLAMESIGCEIQDEFGHTAINGAQRKGYDDIVQAIHKMSGGVDEDSHPRIITSSRPVLSVEWDACMLGMRPDET